MAELEELFLVGKIGPLLTSTLATSDTEKFPREGPNAGFTSALNNIL